MPSDLNKILPSDRPPPSVLQGVVFIRGKTTTLAEIRFDQTGEKATYISWDDRFSQRILQIFFLPFGIRWHFQKLYSTVM